MTALWIVLGVIAVLVIGVVLMYNGLIALRNRVKNAWSQIDVQLKRRHDLIPNLVETAKGYMQHERQTLENITRARNLAAKASTVGESAQAEQELNSALSNFFVVVENYPDLKANQNFLALQEELTSTENRISFARQFYNDQVMKLNTRVQMVPYNFIANLGGIHEEEFFEIESPAEREAPKVSFS